MHNTQKNGVLMSSKSEFDIITLDAPSSFEMEAPYEVNICRALAIKVEQLSHSIFDSLHGLITQE